MRRILFPLAAAPLAGLLMLACASSPPPTANFAKAAAAVRAAEEVGAARTPQGALHLKVAKDELAQARALINDDENERANYMTLRAYNDAELALAHAREEQARERARQAAERVRGTTVPGQ